MLRLRDPRKLILALDEAHPHGRKVIAESLGTTVYALSRWVNDRREFPPAAQEDAFALLLEERPDIAARLLQDELGKHGILVSVARVGHSTSTRRAGAEFQREAADVAGAAADADEDGERSVEDVERLIREQREAIASGEAHLVALFRDLGAAREREGVVPLPLTARGGGR
jgi:hypothetical protein